MSSPRYLFQRGSVWHVRLQPPGQPVIERSLCTSDLKLAEITAMPLIRQHKTLMYQRRLARLPHVESRWLPAYALGLHADEGFFATERELRDLKTGAIIGPNGGPAEILMPAPSDGVPSFEAYDAAKARTTPTARHADDEIIEAYLRHTGANRRAQRECRQTWQDYRAIVGKPLATATRADGRVLAEHYLAKEFGEGKKLKSASVVRKLAWLAAACNFAISEGTIKFNPFLAVVPRRDDKTRRLPLDDADMVLVRENLGKLSTSDQLLVRLLACTGMRRSETFQITGEQCEGGVRFVVAGEKTAQSLRRIPLPAAVLPFLPEKITAPLFGPNTDSNIDRTGKRLLRWLRDIGINGHDKTVHSLRHRAQDRLRAAGCPLDIREELLGHENVTVGKSYGLGHPVPVLKEWIDKIGM